VKNKQKEGEQEEDNLQHELLGGTDMLTLLSNQLKTRPLRFNISLHQRSELSLSAIS